MRHPRAFGRKCSGVPWGKWNKNRSQTVYSAKKGNFLFCSCDEALKAVGPVAHPPICDNDESDGDIGAPLLLQGEYFCYLFPTSMIHLSKVSTTKEPLTDRMGSATFMQCCGSGSGFNGVPIAWTSFVKAYRVGIRKLEVLIKKRFFF
jgi:hypothetical protein